MGESAKTPWVQTGTGAVAINGVVAAVVGAITTAIINNASRLPWVAIGAVGVGAAIGAFVVLSVVQKRLRGAVWKRPFRWVGGLRVTTWAQRRDIEDRGYSKRSAELAVEREGIAQPVWRVSARDRLGGQNNLYWLEDRGGAASDVRLRAKPSHFMLNGEVHFPNPFGAQRNGLSEGQPFFGGPTELGEREGVLFHVSWRDAIGDQRSTEVTLPSKEILAGTSDAIEEARNQGWKDGYQTAKDAAVPDVPPPRPRWVLVAKEGFWPGGRDFAVVRFVLKHQIAGSVARGVRVEATDSETRITDAGYWQDLSGVASEAFDAQVPEWVPDEGVTIFVTWHDHESVERHQNVTAPAFDHKLKAIS